MGIQYLLKKVENLPPEHSKNIPYKKGFVILKIKDEKVIDVLRLKNGSVLDEIKAMTHRNRLTAEMIQERLQRLD